MTNDAGRCASLSVQAGSGAVSPGGRAIVGGDRGGRHAAEIGRGLD